MTRVCTTNKFEDVFPPFLKCIKMFDSFVANKLLFQSYAHLSSNIVDRVEGVFTFQGLAAVQVLNARFEFKQKVKSLVIF